MGSDVAAATYFVDPASGSDANNGAATSAAWATVPGTRTVDASAFLRTGWGTVTQTKKVACGDKILLKGGSTYTKSQGGAWRIDSDYYSSCTAANPITIKVATSAEWAGSNGNFTIDGSGISPSSKQYGTVCTVGGRCGLIAIEMISGLIFEGASGSQRIILNPVNTSPYASGVMLMGTIGAMSMQDVRLGWLDISHNSGLNIGAGIDVGDLKYSYVHDVKIHDWQGPGISVGMFTAAHRVHSLVIENTEIGPNVGLNMAGTSCVPQAYPALYMPGSEYDDATAGGGAWCLNCYIHDNYADGFNGFGCNSGGEDGIAKLRDTRFAGNGTVNGNCANGMQLGGDSSGCVGGTGDALPEQTVVTIRGQFYDNRRVGIDSPHGGGSHWLWHPTFYRAGAMDGSIGVRLDSTVVMVANGIVDTSTGGSPAFQYQGGSGVTNDGNRVAPNVFNTLVRAASSSSSVSYLDTQCSTDNGATWTGTKCRSGSCPSGQTCRQRGSSGTVAAPPGFLVGSGNVVSASDVGFVAAGGSCNTPFIAGTGAPGFPSCDFRLQSTSPAIDPPSPVFVLMANGAGTNASVITVKAGTPEPEQLVNPPLPGSNYASVAGGLSWGARPHAADPRTYFISPQNHPWATGDVIQIVGTCTNGVSRHGAAGRTRIVSMTSRTITVDDTCTWADGAGVHWPFNGNSPDMGAYEFGITNQGGISAPTLISVSPVP